MIQVPYWWNRQYSSLASTVYEQRPDLFNEKPSADVIPKEPPVLNKRTHKKSFLMTATEWDERDPKGWFMNEKYDGARMYWDGASFYSRTGEIIKVPQSIVSQMPSVALDGELW